MIDYRQFLSVRRDKAAFSSDRRIIGNVGQPGNDQSVYACRLSVYRNYVVHGQTIVR